MGYGDIETFSRVTGEIMMREEIGLLLAMDDAYLAAVNEEHDQARKRSEAKKGK
ncbi:hypothetical protein [Martelella limonii]|uniref:hypothetical protein n=1 Tax=Martelella limonii TaxID=1647649 RepID=UPI0015812194|nr:hypothetical protein [Martelella limonii]